MLARQTYDQWAGDHSSAMIETAKFIQSDEESPQKRKIHIAHMHYVITLRSQPGLDQDTESSPERDLSPLKAESGYSSESESEANYR